VFSGSLFVFLTVFSHEGCEGGLGDIGWSVSVLWKWDILVGRIYLGPLTDSSFFFYFLFSSRSVTCTVQCKVYLLDEEKKWYMKVSRV